MTFSPAKEKDFSITVCDPTNVGDGMKMYTTYKVETHTSAPQFKKTDFSVQRRYKEFLWLYQQLSTNNPGVIVPPAPEKHAMGRFEEDFVETDVFFWSAWCRRSRHIRF